MPSRFGAHLRHWHRRLGVFSAAFLVWLAVTGVAINEAASLGLDHAEIGWPWLMQVYGLRAEAPAEAWLAEGHALIALGAEGSALDGHALQPAVAAPLGLAAIRYADRPLLAVANLNLLVLLDTAGARVETLDAATLPAVPLTRIGALADGRLVIEAGAGRSWSTADGLDWQPLPAAAAVRWSEAAPLPETARAQAAAASAPHLPALRVLADLHSGRLFGPLGPKLIDLAALCASLLAASGVWMVLRAQRRHHHAHPH